ncbi:MAG: proline dehydrogenase family protein [Chlamydiae bacterium]|nr:proline dehydrogenase family protein [Chlamydiota bacterium]
MPIENNKFLIMGSEQPTSFYLEAALELINSVKEKKFTSHELLKKGSELAELIFFEAKNLQRREEKTQINSNFIFQNPKSAALLTNLQDICFRSCSKERVINQIKYLLKKLSVPAIFSFSIKTKLALLQILGGRFSNPLYSEIINFLKKENRRHIISYSEPDFSNFLNLEQNNNCFINIYPFAKHPFEYEKELHENNYFALLNNPKISSISLKISDLFPNLKLQAYDWSLKKILNKLRDIFFMAKPYMIQGKFIHFDPKMHKDYKITLEALKIVLSEKEFLDFSVRITLQAYMPEAHQIQRELMSFSSERIKKGGPPIKILLVKGSYISSEQIRASKNSWPLPIYNSKIQTDANFKKMLFFSTINEHSKILPTTIGTHNIFDLAYALVLRKISDSCQNIDFEMLYGRTPLITKIIEQLSGKMTLYCPIAPPISFNETFPYLLSRIEELTGSENFLCRFPHMEPQNGYWEEELNHFFESGQYSSLPILEKTGRAGKKWPQIIKERLSFENEPATDFSIKDNALWAEEIVSEWQHFQPSNIPITIGEKIFFCNEKQTYSISNPQKFFYKYSECSKEQFKSGLEIAKQAQISWQNISIEEKATILYTVAEKIRENRKKIIAALMLDIEKTIVDADHEVSDAIDTIEYSLEQSKQLLAIKDVELKAKGIIFIASHFSAPIAIAAQEISAALIMGNSVIFNPTSSAMFCSFLLAEIFWEANVPKNSLQFIKCSSSFFEEEVIKDDRINSIIISDSLPFAKKILKLNPKPEIQVTSASKNIIVISSLCDKELAIQDLIRSAFTFSGQKFSSTQVAILEKEIFDDSFFLKELTKAAKELVSDAPWDLTTTLTPLVNATEEEIALLKNLDKDESWILKPVQAKNNQNLWSPGIKNVSFDSPSLKKEYRVPLLCILKAKDFEQALSLANKFSSGLCVGLHSLDEREHFLFLTKIEAGNFYINRKTIDTLIKRQPFGGTEKSCYGYGYKKGGANYLLNFTSKTQLQLPKEKQPPEGWILALTKFLQELQISKTDLELWEKSIANYSYWWKKFKLSKDPNKVLGEDNIQRYIPRKVTLRLLDNKFSLDALRVCAAALTVESSLEISITYSKYSEDLFWLDLIPVLKVVEETPEEFLSRIKQGKINRIRLISKASDELAQVAKENFCFIIDEPVLASGRFELLHYLQEISLSYDYHRYGYLGLRQAELRKIPEGF